MLSKSDLRENRKLRNQVDEILIGPDRKFWKNALHRFLRKDEPVFTEMESLDPFRKEKRSWQKFYKKIFGLDLDFSDVRIPDRPSSTKDWWLIIVAKGMTPQQLYSKCKELFPCWCWTDENLDCFRHRHLSVPYLLTIVAFHLEFFHSNRSVPSCCILGSMS
ncbi:MAG: hypothetical protein NT170_02460 [Candidatus Moranbacteria bacterium]|nr:hypothetical protein [Candidatus Moranbacteria bacterium]